MKSEFVQGDTGAFLQIACRDVGTGGPLDLSAASAVTMRYSLNGGAAVERAMSVVNATEGLAQYKFVANELEAGHLRTEVTITRASGTLTSEAPMLFTVRGRIE